MITSKQMRYTQGATKTQVHIYNDTVIKTFVKFNRKLMLST
jgi:hypothetical protein